MQTYLTERFYTVSWSFLSLYQSYLKNKLSYTLTIHIV